MKKSVSFIIFGGTGDLTKRKLVPAVAQMLESGTISKNSLLIGVGRSSYTDKTYAKLIQDSATSPKDKACISNLQIRYFQTDSSQKDALKKLPTLLKKYEPKKCTNRVFYLATTYKIFPNIVKNLRTAKLDTKQSQIVFEKPFGHSLASALQLEKQIHTVFSEDKIYRIDHYLGKETIQNLTVLKFTNPILDAVLNNKFVDTIEVVANEDLGVGERLGYYSGAGAVKDMVQSHLLQVLSLMLMDRPTSMFSAHIHDQKVAVLKKTKLLPAKNHLLGQYKGYTQELTKTELKKSNTETFCRICLECKNKRWKGTKLILQSGKHLNKKLGRITVHFKAIDNSFIHEFKGIRENKMIIDIQPDQDIKLLFNTRKPQTENIVEPVEMDFCGTCEFGANTSDGYQRLLTDVIFHHHTLFTRYDELREAWNIVDSFEKIRKNVPFITYKKGVNPENL